VSRVAQLDQAMEEHLNELKGTSAAKKSDDKKKVLCVCVA
jgi:hypothetical protein